jgi:hypothetical protein
VAEGTTVVPGPSVQATITITVNIRFNNRAHVAVNFSIPQLYSTLVTLPTLFVT